MNELTKFLQSISRDPGFEEMEELRMNSRSYLGETPLQAAAILGDAEAIKLLVQAGADINALESFGYSPFHLAAEQRHVAAWTS